MERLTTDDPKGNFQMMLNFVYSKDGVAYIRHDGEQEDVPLTEWARRQCLLRGCDEFPEMSPEEIDNAISDCMMSFCSCPIAFAYCFASQACHLRSRLKMYEDAVPLARVQVLAQVEKDRRLVVHGKWMTTDYMVPYGRCSVCQHESKADDYGYVSPYCPWCGAKMEADNETD